MQKNAVVAKHVALLAIILLRASSSPAAPEHSPTLNDLMDRADAVVAAEIQRTDYRQTAKDGPMVAAARNLKCVKGKFSPGDTFEFAETGWWQPQYKKGETRVLFLKRQQRRQADAADVDALWRTVYADSLNFFIEPDRLPSFSKDAVESFLRETRELQHSKASLSATVQEQRKDSFVILTNVSSPDKKSIWIHRETFKVSFHGKENGKDFVHVLEIPIPAASRAGPFIEIEADKPLVLRFEIKREHVEGMASVQLLFANRVLVFPKRCWSGLQRVSVALTAPPDATPPPQSPDREATVIAFFGALFSDAEFVSKMKPIVGTLRAMLVRDMTIEGVRIHEARMAKQWTEEAGPVFFRRLKDANVARADVLWFTTKMQQPNSDQREATINRILHKAKLRAPPEVTYLFLSLALEYIHGRLNAAATEKRATQREGRGG